MLLFLVFPISISSPAKPLSVTNQLLPQTTIATTCQHHQHKTTPLTFTILLTLGKAGSVGGRINHTGWSAFDALQQGAFWKSGKFQLSTSEGVSVRWADGKIDEVMDEWING